jgi:hypothetical protein
MQSVSGLCAVSVESVSGTRYLYHDTQIPVTLPEKVFIFDMFVNCNWVETRWQYTFTHTQYTEHHN